MHRFEEDLELKECANCGEVDGLLKCSRCRNSWFCSVQCQKSYWPFHRASCKANEFADAMENQDPKFAKWMRTHGKMAVLKDDQVERLERANAAVSGPSKQDVMESMYGRLDPKPQEPSYTAEERILMKNVKEDDAHQNRVLTYQQQRWREIQIPADLGIDCDEYKWRQNQSHVEMFVKIPEKITGKRVLVDLKPKSINIGWDDFTFMSGPLEQEIKQEDSTWFIEGGILEVHMLKKFRRGNYADGKTNADTFWRSILSRQSQKETLQLKHPPSCYYQSYFECTNTNLYNLLNNGRKSAKGKA